MNTSPLGLGASVSAVNNGAAPPIIYSAVALEMSYPAD